MLWARFVQAPSRDRRALLRAFIELTVVRCQLAAMPYARVHALALASLAGAVSSGEEAERAAWAVEALGRHLPIFSNCLVRSLAAVRLLRRLGHEPRLCFGAARSGTAPLDAHAWVTLGDRIIVGEIDRPFTPFAERKARACD